jgi:hypothetical protein
MAWFTGHFTGVYPIFNGILTMVSGEDFHNKSLIFLGHLRGKGVLGRDQSFNTARFWCLIYISYIYIYHPDIHDYHPDIHYHIL